MKKQTENTTQATPEDKTLADLQAENEQLKATIRLNAAQRLRLRMTAEGADRIQRLVL
ncbi:MAG: hypothetical protein KA746_00300 [Pyrinomonadaceae bacterium]|nr:hypothetical protein [Pyrinomonadaceae bacterium]MBP6213426.1 hypothetical protein [Pyrinomonadaceae bacterium]